MPIPLSLIQKYNKNTENCKNLGIKILKGHFKKNILKAIILVIMMDTKILMDQYRMIVGFGMK